MNGPTPAVIDDGSWLEVLADWAVSLMERLGAPGAGLAIALENLFPPLPSEVILPLAGFAASRGELSLAAAIGWTTAGSLVGAAVLYELGGILGPTRLRALVDRLPLLHVEDLDRAEDWFHRHGSRAVFIGRMIPLVRSLVSVPAGIARMPRPRFLLLTALGSLLWNTAFIAAGFALGESYHLIERYAGIASRVVLLALAILVVSVIAKRIRNSPAQRRPPRSSPGP